MFAFSKSQLYRKLSHCIAATVCLLMVGRGLVVPKARAASPQTATLAISPSTGTVTVGNQVAVDVLLSTGNQGVGGVQVELDYSSNLTYTSFDATNTVFPTDVTDPTVSSNSLTFARVTTASSGYNGSNGQVLHLVFTTTAVGAATITINQSASEADESSTSDNILQTVSNGSYTIVDVVPAAPTSLTATSSSSSQINLTWTAPSGVVTGYKLYSDGGNGGAFSLVASPSSTAQSVTGLSASTTYVFEVRATNSGGDSPASAAAQATTLANSAPPVAPASPQANMVSSTAIDLTWTASPSATSYTVKQGSSSGSEVQVATPSASPYHATGLTPSTTYFFTVTATNNLGDSSASTEVSATTSAPAPSAPTALSASAFSSSQINLTWTAPSGTVTGYKVYQSIDGTTFTLAASPSGTSQNVTGLTGGTTYTFKVVASNAGGDSPASAPAQATTPAPPPPVPAQPSGVQVTAVSSTALDITWTAVSGATGYVVGQSTTAGAESQVSMPNSSPYHATGLTPATRYFYTITATNNSGSSTVSTEASGFTQPSAPSSLTATTVSSSQINLTWTAPSGTVTGYRVYSNGGSGSTYTLYSSSSTTNLNVSGLIGSTPYTFQVKAYNAGGDSQFSNTASASTSVALATTIAGIYAMPSSTGATISWVTDQLANTRLQYGISNSYGFSTALVDTGGVTSHSVSLSGIPACAVIHFQSQSASLQSADQIFTTTGCPGSAAVVTSNDAVISQNTGGNVSLLNSGYGLSLTVSPGSTTSANQFAIKKLASTAALAGTGLPATDLSLVGGHIYHLQSLDPSLALTSTFLHPLSVSIAYSASELANFNPATLTLRKWDAGTGWTTPGNCSYDATGRTVTCPTSSFSTFALFADAVPTVPVTAATTGSGGAAMLPVTGSSSWLFTIPGLGIAGLLLQNIFKTAIPLPTSLESLAKGAEQPIAPANPSVRRRRGLQDDILFPLSFA